ncbi:hypothetical protein E6O75_ATG02759 [Venturia nashicola]|uniref:Uncharacterized protein n=1 Tax=Venturia nashicola TaxID=86259 RepID=A0A4Z1PPQ0_9PEZI|nr:hypothetical protein E6O75_ATG02759 [Venturia nashicola]
MTSTTSQLSMYITISPIVSQTITSTQPITWTSSINGTIFAASDESYTSACGTSSIYSSFQDCAHRAYSLRDICTSSYGSLTVWPGPCECSYYQQDLACFDERAFCASQIWTQAPQWFRDGVTSCLGLDSSYAIRAQIGTFENPFTVAGLAGVNATTSTARPVSTSAIATNTDTPEALGSRRLGSGAMAGAIIGSLAGLFLLTIGIYLFLRHSKLSKKRRDMEAEAENEKSRMPELHDKDAIIHMKETKDNSHEAPGAEPPELKGDEFAYEADSGEIYELESPKSPRSWFGM